MGSNSEDPESHIYHFYYATVYFYSKLCLKSQLDTDSSTGIAKSILYSA